MLKRDVLLLERISKFFCISTSLHDLHNDYPLRTEKRTVTKEMLLDCQLPVIEDNIFFLGKNENHISNTTQNCKEWLKKKLTKSRNKMINKETM